MLTPPYTIDFFNPKRDIIDGYVINLHFKFTHLYLEQSIIQFL